MTTRQRPPLDDGYERRGADLTFLSAFPAEKEVLFPPQTYLRPTGRTEAIQTAGKEWRVVEVTASFAS